MRERLERHPWVVRGRRAYEEALVTPVGQLGVALYEVRLRDRALTLAGQAFIALVPLLVVVASMVGSSGGEAVGEWLVDRLDLTGTSAEAVTILFSRPPAPGSGTSLVSLLVLLVSVNSFGRALQRTFEVAWRLPSRGRRRALHGALGTGLLLLTMVAVVFLTGVLGQVPGGRLVAVPAQLALAVPAWWALTRLLLNLRVGWAATLPGAVVSAVAQVLASWASAIWLPILIERDAQRYGVVGVAVALVWWLVALAFVVVASAVAGAWASRASGSVVDLLRRSGRVRAGRGDGPR